MRENPSLAHGIVESQNAELVRCSSRLISRHGHRRHSLRAVLVALETDDWRKEQGRGVTDGHLSTVKLCRIGRSEEHTSELQSLMRISYAVFCLKKKKTNKSKATQTKPYQS